MINQSCVDCKKGLNTSHKAKRCFSCYQTYRATNAKVAHPKRLGDRFCECGNKLTPQAKKMCRPCWRIKLGQRDQSGDKNPQWKGGRTEKTGYTLMRVAGHPFADKRGYVKEHRYVVEQSIGRYLKRSEIVHHKNHNRKDNRIENLEVLTLSQHMKLHKPHRYRKCYS